MAPSRPKSAERHRLSRLTTAPVPQKRFKGLPRSRGDVMLDAFGVGFRRLGRRANGDEEIDHQAVALTRAFRHRRARFGQKDTAIGLGSRQPLAFQAGNGLAGGGMGDPHPPRDIGRAGFAIGGDQVGDQFGIILEQRGRQERAGLARHAAAQGRTMSDVLREWLRQLPEPKPRAKR